MSRILFCISLLLGCYPIKAQHWEQLKIQLDSLSKKKSKNEFKSYLNSNFHLQSLEDSTSFLLYCCQYYSNNNIEKKRIVSYSEYIISRIVETKINTQTIKENLIRSIKNIYNNGNSIDWDSLYDNYFSNINLLLKGELEHQMTMLRAFSYMASTSGNYARSINIEKVLQTLLKETNNLNTSVEARYYGGLGLNLYNKKKYEKAAFNFEKAISILELISYDTVKTDLLSEYYSMLGESYNALHNKELGLKNTLIGLKKFQALPKVDSSTLIYYLNAVAESYLINDSLDKAKLYYFISIAIDSNDRSTFLSLAEIESRLKNYNSAHIYLQKAEKLYNFSTIEDLQSLKSPNSFNNVLIQKASIFKEQYKQYNQRYFLDSALTCYENQLIISFFNINNYFEDINKMEYYQQQVKYCYQELDLLFELYTSTKQEKYLHRMLDISELSKNLLLFSKYQKNTSSISDTLSNDIITEKRILQQINNLEKEIFEKGASTQRIELLFKKQTEYDSVITILKKTNPLYFKSIFNPINQVYAKIRHYLSDSMTIVEYCLTPTRLYTFLLLKNELKLITNQDTEIETSIKILNKNLQFQQLSDISKQKSDLILSSKKLYQILIEPIEKDLSKNNIFIPDTKFQSLSFDILVKPETQSNAKLQEINYFIQEHNVSYEWSITFLIEKSTSKEKKEHEVLAVAPFGEVNSNMNNYPNRSNFNALPFSSLEINTIKTLFKTNILLNEKATKEQFLNLSKSNTILHLATHSKANDSIGDFSYLVFYPKTDTIEHSLLYAKDIYQLQLSSDLIVLSSCESGIGELQVGEGFNGLARAFQSAGAKSILFSLWEIHDEKTQRIISKFYSYLKNGNSKSMALSQAKRDFLNEEKGYFLYPYFWGGLKLVGN